MQVFYEDNHIMVVLKKPNQPVQEDESKDYDLVNELKAYLKEKYQKPGNVFVGLVHRLDRPVGGIMVFAKTSKAASRLSDQIRTKSFTKEYIAIVEGKIKPGIYEDYLYKDKKTNTSKIVNKNHKEAKFSQLEVLESSYDKESNLSLVKINLITGRSHQIRVQMASRNHPLWGDARYNSHAKPGQQIALWSSLITFKHPTLKKSMTFTCPCPNTYPFTLW